MADPVALQIQPPDTFTKLGQIMGIANSATELQRNRATLQADIARRKAESRGATASADTAEIERGVAQQTAPSRISSAKLTLAKQHLGFNEDLLGKTDANFASILQDPSIKAISDPNTPPQDLPGHIQHLNDALDTHARLVKRLIPVEAPADAESKVDAGLAIYKDMLNKDPLHFQQFIAQRQQANLSPESQVAQGQVPAGQQQAVTTGVGGAPQVTTKSQFGTAGIAPAPIAGGIPGAQRLITDALGNPAIQETSPTGQVSIKPAPNSNTPPLMQMPPGETADTAKPLMALRQQTNQAAAEVPAQHFNNEQIIRLAPSAFTGTGGGTIAKILGSVGIQATNDNAADTAQLNHFLALQTENNAKAMGANTDAARLISERAAGSAASPEVALKRIAKINDAYATGLELFNRGMETAIKSPDNQKSIFAARDFQNQWSQTFDPAAMMLHNAIIAKGKAGNAKEKMDAQHDIDTITRSVGGKGSQGARDLAQKYFRIEKLTSEGHL